MKQSSDFNEIFTNRISIPHKITCKKLNISVGQFLRYSAIKHTNYKSSFANNEKSHLWPNSGIHEDALCHRISFLERQKTGDNGWIMALSIWFRDEMPVKVLTAMENPRITGSEKAKMSRSAVRVMVTVFEGHGRHHHVWLCFKGQNKVLQILLTTCERTEARTC